MHLDDPSGPWGEKMTFKAGHVAGTCLEDQLNIRDPHHKEALGF